MLKLCLESTNIVVNFQNQVCTGEPVFFGYQIYKCVVKNLNIYILKLIIMWTYLLDMLIYMVYIFCVHDFQKKALLVLEYYNFFLFLINSILVSLYKFCFIRMFVKICIFGYLY